MDSGRGNGELDVERGVQVADIICVLACCVKNPNRRIRNVGEIKKPFPFRETVYFLSMAQSRRLLSAWSARQDRDLGRQHSSTRSWTPVAWAAEDSNPLPGLDVRYCAGHGFLNHGLSIRIHSHYAAILHA